MKNYIIITLSILSFLFMGINKANATIDSKYLLFCPFLANYIEDNGSFKYDSFNTIYNGTDVATISDRALEPTPFNPLEAFGIPMPYDVTSFNEEDFLKSWNAFGIKSADYTIINNSVSNLVINSLTCDPDAYDEYTKYGDVIAEVCTSDDLSFNDLFYGNIDATTNNIEYLDNNDLTEKGFQRDSSLVQFPIGGNNLDSVQLEENENGFKYGVIFFDFMDKILNSDKKKICHKAVYKDRSGNELRTYCNAPPSGEIPISSDAISAEVVSYFGGTTNCKLELDFRLKVNSSIVLYNVENLGTGYTVGYGTVKCERDESTNQPVLSVVQNDPATCDVDSLGVFDPAEEPLCNELCVYVGNSCPPLDISWGTGEVCRGTLPFMIGNPDTSSEPITIYSTNPRTTGQISYKCIATASGFVWDIASSGTCTIN